MIKIATRAERGLEPYVSPKKKWDEDIALQSELLVERTPSMRRERRIRQADSRVTAKKSRRNAARQQYAAEQFEQNLLGIARVYLRGAGNDAMRRNVTEHVHTIAEQRSKSTGQPFTTALKEVEGKLLSALGAVDA